MREDRLVIVEDVKLEAPDEVEGAAVCEVVFVDFEVVVEEFTGLRAG